MVSRREPSESQIPVSGPKKLIENVEVLNLSSSELLVLPTALHVLFKI